MLFSSAVFLFLFLPCVILLYYAIPGKFKNLCLLLASLFFYFWGEPIYSILLLVSSLLGYVFGLLINKTRGTWLSKFWLICSLVTSLGSLAFFKYSDFAIRNINSIFGTTIDLLEIALPIGISFYTFQVLSYTIDVYRGNVEVQKNPISFAAYIALFPQLIAGPIVRYETIEHQLNHRTHSVEAFASGIMRFICGLGKKVIIANSLAELIVDLSEAQPTVIGYWASAIAFTLQIYFDFSGYSDMAIGLGRIFGFDFLENFNYPFVSRSITEFWRRWHISLGSWFRDYVYIPLGGNRCSKGRWFLNVLVVWTLTGLWHGASWNFVIWGLYFALFLLIEKLFLGNLLEKLPSFIRSIYVMFFIVISFVIFNADSFSDALKNLGGMFGADAQAAFSSSEALYRIGNYLVLIIIAAVLSTPVIMNLIRKIRQNKTADKVFSILEPISCVVVLAVVTGYLVDGSFSPFLYFRF